MGGFCYVLDHGGGDFGLNGWFLWKNPIAIFSVKCHFLATTKYLSKNLNIAQIFHFWNDLGINEPSGITEEGVNELPDSGLWRENEKFERFHLRFIVRASIKVYEPNFCHFFFLFSWLPPFQKSELHDWKSKNQCKMQAIGRQTVENSDLIWRLSDSWEWVFTVRKSKEAVCDTKDTFFRGFFQVFGRENGRQGYSQCSHYNTGRIDRFVWLWVCLGDKENPHLTSFAILCLAVLSELPITDPALVTSLLDKSLLFHPRVAEEARNLLAMQDANRVQQLVRALEQTNADHM